MRNVTVSKQPNASLDIQPHKFSFKLPKKKETLHFLLCAYFSKELKMTSEKNKKPKIIKFITVSAKLQVVMKLNMQSPNNREV